MDIPAIQLNENTKIPKIGLGTWKLTDDSGQAAIQQALELGYRHIDTAYHYHNQETVGRAITEAGVSREDVFVTTKIWRDHLEPEKLRAQFQESLRQLDMDYVDLLLVHWPNESVPISDTLQAMADLKEAGTVKSIGVSNFTIPLLKEVLATDIDVSVNQVEYHPSLVQKTLKSFCEAHGITLTAYSPLGHNGRDLSLGPVQSIAEQQSVSPAAVIIAWLIQQGIVAIPKATTRAHQKQNLQARNITLTDDQIAAINACDQDHRIIAPDYGPFSGPSRR